MKHGFTVLTVPINVHHFYFTHIFQGIKIKCHQTKMLQDQTASPTIVKYAPIDSQNTQKIIQNKHSPKSFEEKHFICFLTLQLCYKISQLGFVLLNHLFLVFLQMTVQHEGMSRSQNKFTAVWIPILDMHPTPRSQSQPKTNEPV